MVALIMSAAVSFHITFALDAIQMDLFALGTLLPLFKPLLDKVRQINSLLFTNLPIDDFIW